jgi:hypothetical protein
MWLLSVTLSVISASLRAEEAATDFLSLAIDVDTFGNRQRKIQWIARRHATAVDNVKNQSSTEMSPGQVKSVNLFHAINETAQEN